MKSALALVASLMALSLGTPQLHAQTTPFNGSTANINPDPKKCCECIEIKVNNQVLDAPNRNLGPFSVAQTGNYEFDVQVNVKPGCDISIESYSVSPKASQGRSNGPLPMQGQTLQVTPSVIRESGKQFTVKVICVNAQGQKGECSIDFEIEEKCDPCGSDGKVCPISLPPTTLSNSFTVSLPVPSEIDGLKGFLRYYTKDFSYGGRSALFASLPAAYGTPQLSGPLFESITQGQWTTLVEDISGQDAFRVIHKRGTTVVRTTTISFVEESGVFKHRMDTEFDNSVTRHEQTNPSQGVYVMKKGKVVAAVFEPIWEETLTKTYPSANIEVQRRVIRERADAAASWSVTSDIETTFERIVHDWEKTKEVIDPSGAALTSTWSYYGPGEITGPGGSVKGLGEIKQHVRYNGYQEFHTYSLNQQSIAVPYAGNPAGKVTTTDWDPGTKTETVTTEINGQLVGKAVTVHTPTTRATTTYTSASDSLTTITHYQASGQDFGGKPILIVRPDNTITTYSYTRQTTGGVETVMEEGASSNGTTVSQGMRTTLLTNSFGTVIYRKGEAIGYSTGSTIFDSMAVTSVDVVGRALMTEYYPTSVNISGENISATGAAWTTTAEYNCCGVAKETDQYGIPTFHAYDHLQRRIKTNRLGVTTELVRNGLTNETHRYPETVSASLSPAFAGTSATLVSKSVTNLAGTLQESWSPDPTSTTPGALVKTTTTISYLPAAGLSTRTVTTTPDNQSQTTDSFLDGRITSTSGALAPAMAYSYAVNSTGEVTSQSYVDGSNLRETTTTQSDWAGRTLTATLMGGATSTMTYNSIGQMTKSTDPDGVTTLFAYNAEGERVISATDLNSNGTIDYGVDTVSYSETEPALDGSNPVMRSISKVWQPGDTSPSGGTVVSTSARSPNGLSNSSQSIGVANSSTSLTTLAGSGNWSTTTTAPDGTKQVQTYSAGLLSTVSSVNTVNQVILSLSHGYDSLNRPITSTDSRTGAIATNYLSATADVVASTTDSGNRTTSFTYDIRGRRISVDAPDSLDTDGNTLANVTTTSYNPDSTVAETTGDQTYRTSHTYDYAQRQVTMTTYGSTTANTTWTYSPTRGFLTRKAYHDGKGTDYTYTLAGRLSTRGWARAVGTSYAYDNGGRLISTTYSDDTPDVTVTYDCLGRQISQSNGTATTTYAYDSATLVLDTETIAYNTDGNPGADFTRILDRSRDNLNRDTGWELKDASNVENSATYTYGSTDGRLASVGRGDTPVPQSFNYSYLPNSNLLSTVTGPAHSVTNTWESTRNVLASKVNSKLDTTVISSYTYIVNHLGQRTGVSTAGTAFAASGSIDWGYNNKGEVVKADSSANTSDRAYQYDGIGNRLKSADSLTLPTSNNYTPNVLNQYSAVGSLTPGYDDDGNMTSGPLPANLSANSTLTWDAENRLISTSVNSVTTTYLYDSQSRRIAQTTGTAMTIYVYDGWNPIAEYSTTTLSKTYTWGMDLSGSMQGAGGVGGLLAVTDTTGSYFPTYDGNGNISEYLDTNGAIAAHYEYDPFGRETVSNGTNPSGFAHRFSTKPLDSATGLLYYGYRYYDPQTGRWPSRDPIQELGGVNLYGFVGNNAILGVDLLGMDPNIIDWNHFKDWRVWLRGGAVKMILSILEKWFKSQIPECYVNNACQDECRSCVGNYGAAASASGLAGYALGMGLSALVPFPYNLVLMTLMTVDYALGMKQLGKTIEHAQAECDKLPPCSGKPCDVPPMDKLSDSNFHVL
jgi:RHS repeat-associated protein